PPSAAALIPPPSSGPVPSGVSLRINPPAPAAPASPGPSPLAAPGPPSSGPAPLRLPVPPPPGAPVVPRPPTPAHGAPPVSRGSTLMGVGGGPSKPLVPRPPVPADSPADDEEPTNVAKLSSIAAPLVLGPPASPLVAGASDADEQAHWREVFEQFVAT